MKYLFFSCFLCFTLFVSCSSDDKSSDDPQLNESSFYALRVGNTWTYEYFERDRESREFVSLNAFDKVKILGTSEINGQTYYSFETTTTGNNSAPVCVPPNGSTIVKLRDSLGYLINENHEILFSNSDQQEYVASENSRPPFDLYGILISGVEDITVSAGTFASLKNEVYTKFEDGSISPGRNVVFYSEEIGQIKKTYSYVTQTESYAEKRLISYEIAD